MAETLGSLCDKLTIVKLKQWHAEDEKKKDSLAGQERQLKAEIDEYLTDAVSGKIPTERLRFDANKVYPQKGNEVAEVLGTIGEVFSRLADVNCKLWHEQERVYEFQHVPPEEKDAVIRQLAVLNLERNKCIDQINNVLSRHINSIQDKRT